MSKETEQKSSSALSVPQLFLLLIAIAGIIFGAVILAKHGDDTAEPTNSYSLTMKVGDMRTLESGLKESFSSAIGNPEIALLDEKNMITALQIGETTITLTGVSGATETYQLKVEQDANDNLAIVTTSTTSTTAETTTTTTTTTVAPAGMVSKIELTTYEVTLKVGEKKMPIVTMYPLDIEKAKKTEKWTSTDEKVATVDWQGNIKAVAPGTCVVRVTSVNNPGVFADVAVTVLGATTAATTTTTTTQTTAVTQNNAAAPVPTGNTGVETQNGITYVGGVMIVNKTYPLPSTYNPGADATATAAFNEMKAAAKTAGYNLTIRSGFRSYNTQKELYDKYVARDGQAKADTYSARPGYSEHQSGLAFDINNASDAFNDTPEAKWLAENAWQYGFILRYPKGKESITGYKYESWHYRYVGKDLAKKIFDSGKTMEEYFGIKSEYAS